MQTNNNKKKDKKNKMSFDVYLDISEISNANKTNMTRMVAYDRSTTVRTKPNQCLLLQHHTLSNPTLHSTHAILYTTLPPFSLHHKWWWWCLYWMVCACICIYIVNSTSLTLDRWTVVLFARLKSSGHRNNSANVTACRNSLVLSSERSLIILFHFRFRWNDTR